MILSKISTSTTGDQEEEEEQEREEQEEDPFEELQQLDYAEDSDYSNSDGGGSGGDNDNDGGGSGGDNDTNNNALAVPTGTNTNDHTIEDAYLIYPSFPNWGSLDHVPRLIAFLGQLSFQSTLLFDKQHKYTKKFGKKKMRLNPSRYIVHQMDKLAKKEVKKEAHKQQQSFLVPKDPRDLFSWTATGGMWRAFRPMLRSHILFSDIENLCWHLTGFRCVSGAGRRTGRGGAGRGAGRGAGSGARLELDRARVTSIILLPTGHTIRCEAFLYFQDDSQRDTRKRGFVYGQHLEPLDTLTLGTQPYKRWRLARHDWFAITASENIEILSMVAVRNVYWEVPRDTQL